MKKKTRIKNRRQNGRKSRYLTPEQDNVSEPEGKTTWSDVYTAGRPLKTNLLGTDAKSRADRRKPEVQDAESAVNSARLLSGREFVALYEAARRAVNPPVAEGEEPQPPAKSVKRPRKKTLERKNSDALPASSSQSPQSPQTSQSSSDEPSKKSARRKVRTIPLENIGSEPGSRGPAVGLRIIGGRYRGTKLQYGGDRRVRPMKDRVREAVFNLIGTEARGRHVLDLFTGTGALAFEALSRGAIGATLVEIHFPTARVTKDNIAALEQLDPDLKTKIGLFTTDVFFWARTLSERCEKERLVPRDVPWLVFCSPPYDFYISRQADMLELLRNVSAVAPEDSLFVLESDERFDFESVAPILEEQKYRIYTPAVIWVGKVMPGSDRKAF